ncbi:hypothetical protein R5M92_13650 [Halomonas sp. Bachu 37]|uniref:hypothetical protein n=1 Tax=Halomonas kashgarensis TaxID=3084920 RepID=UPI003216A48E
MTVLVFVSLNTEGNLGLEQVTYEFKENFMKDHKLLGKLSLNLATLGVASTFILVSAAQAQTDIADRAEAEFKELDQNSDQVLDWEELRPRLEESQVQGGRENILGEYDRDNDQALNQEEYQRLLVFITEQERDGEGEVVVQAQQPRVAVDSEPPEVNVDPAEPRVSVQQISPNVRVEPAGPDVTVDQKRPTVIVRQPRPEVTVNIPKPEVEVILRDPDVDVESGRPDVSVELQEPRVDVSQGQPDVDVQRSEPDVSVQPAKPRVVVDEEGEADVSVQDEGQAQVEVEEAQADVQVADNAEADVEVDSAEGARVRITQAQQQALDNVQVDSVMDSVIVNQEGDELGSVVLIVIERSTNSPGLVVESDEKRVLIPLNEVRVNDDDQLVWATSNTLEQMSDYQSQNYTEVPEQDVDTLGQLRNAQQ